MSYPANLDTIVVRHKIVDTGGKPMKGNSVRAVATKRIWATDGSLIPFETTARVQADGSYEFELPYVDQDGIHNKGVPFQVTEDVPGSPRHYFIAPVLAHGAGPIDATEALVEAPVGYEVKIQAGPVTDAAAASLLDQDGQFKAALTGTYATHERLAEVATGQEAALTDSAVAGALTGSGNAAAAAVESRVVTRVAVDEAPLSPLRYGATVNGTSIQAAIDAAAASRGAVLIPGGSFTIGAAGLNLRDGVRLHGMGKGKTRLTHTANTYAIRAQGTAADPFTGCEVADLTIEGTNATVSQMGIHFEYVNAGLIARCDVGHMGNNSINYHYGNNGRIEGNDVHHNENFGILFFNSNRLAVVNNHVHDLTAAGKQHFGIQSKSSQLCQVTDNRVERIAGHGLYAYSDGTMPDFGHVLANNIVTDLLGGGSAAGIGIYLNTTYALRLIGNHVEDADSLGISTSVTTRATIEANTVIGTAGPGIGTNATTSLAAILGNVVDECAQGITLTGTTKSRVAQNTITRGMSAASGLFALIALRGTASGNVVENNTALEGVSRGIYEEGTASNNVIRNNTVGQTTGNAFSALGAGGIRTGNITVAADGTLTAL